MKAVSHIARHLTDRAAPLRRTAASMLLLLGVAVAPAWASGLQVSPLLVEFEPNAQAQALRLTNTGSDVLRAQVRVQRWTQDDQEDRLEPAREVAASPAMLEVGPGEQQLVRLVRLDPSPTAHEQSFRVLVDELPDEDTGQAKSGLQFLLRYSIPVFVKPAALHVAPSPQPGAAPLTDLGAIRAQLEPDGPDGSRLVVTNEGRQRIRISVVDMVGADGTRTTVNPGLFGYVLSGQTMAWHLPHPIQPGATLEARFNDDEHQQALPLDGTGR